MEIKLSLQSYQEAVSIISENLELSDFQGPKNMELVIEAENKLGLSFPVTYRQFLLNFGAGGFGSEMILGIIDTEFDYFERPDAIGYTLLLRGKKKIPNNYVVIHEVGDGELFCLDTSQISNGECAVVAFEPGLPVEIQPYEVVAPDFGDLLLEIVKQQFL